MDIRVIREHYTPDCTIGRLLIDGEFECYTLEDGIRTNKVYGETAIPAGTYPVKITHSPAFRCQLPLLENVPNFAGIRIHPGNTKKDTLGCILVGRTWAAGSDTIGASRVAFNALFARLQEALSAGERVTLSVEQPNAPADLAVRTIRRAAKRRPGSATKKTASGKAPGRATRETSPRKPSQPPAKKTARTAPTSKARKQASTAARPKDARAANAKKPALKRPASAPGRKRAPAKGAKARSEPRR